MTLTPRTTFTGYGCFSTIPSTEDTLALAPHTSSSRKALPSRRPVEALPPHSLLGSTLRRPEQFRKFFNPGCRWFCHFGVCRRLRDNCKQFGRGERATRSPATGSPHPPRCSTIEFAFLGGNPEVSTVPAGAVLLLSSGTALIPPPPTSTSSFGHPWWRYIDPLPRSWSAAKASWGWPTDISTLSRKSNRFRYKPHSPSLIMPSPAPSLSTKSSPASSPVPLRLVPCFTPGKTIDRSQGRLLCVRVGRNGGCAMLLTRNHLPQPSPVTKHGVLILLETCVRKSRARPISFVLE